MTTKVFARTMTISDVPSVSGHGHLQDATIRSNSADVLTTISGLLESALSDMGCVVPDDLLYRWSFLIRSCMTCERRCYHSLDHIFMMCESQSVTDRMTSGSRLVSGRQRVAALFHDVVYVQVDQGILCPKTKDMARNSFNLSTAGEYTVAEPNGNLPLLFAQSVFG
eukprot:CAMPEP_0196596130 /NCGR_PEP_ID=MMETSP1081-20130531/84305_1 /TAXON_ID=36882 /ORGANISM="Pyramimonas amylifera, Strain CCMP720" /LENGTH=166 /DNA_ID=CAMNT_0041920991 /DNA_START=81 /DNA_END=578 /DNA_ORIENTATION=-